jgi:hypothetical protein
MNEDRHERGPENDGWRRQRRGRHRSPGREERKRERKTREKEEEVDVDLSFGSVTSNGLAQLSRVVCFDVTEAKVVRSK